MLTYSFADIGSDSLYIHLYKCIKNDILQGNLLPNSKLPSKRSFAKNLGISIITIENAYSQLMMEGYIYSLPKKGFFVSSIDVHPLENIVLSKDNIKKSTGEKNYLIDFTGSQTDSNNFPFSIWAKLIREILNDNQKELMKNPPCGGLIELREAIALHLKEFRNINVSYEQIIVGAGTEYLYSLLIQLLGYDKTFAVENPGYEKIARIYKHNNVNCCYLNMDSSGIIISELDDKKSDIVHISPAHHFPTGIVMPISRRYELLAWASKDENRYIIEDEYDSEFRLIGHSIPALSSIDVMEKVIYINTFSKSLASTVRISYMVLPPKLINRFYSQLSFYSCTVSNFEQYTLYKFISEGYFEKHINRMRNYYHNKRDLILLEIKNSPLAPFVKISEENAGLHFLISIKTKKTDTEYCQEVLNYGIKIKPLSAYYQKDSYTEVVPKHIFIINYSNVNEASIKEAIDGLYKSI